MTGLPFFHLLIDAHGLEFEPVSVVLGGDDELDVIPDANPDSLGSKLIFLGVI